MDEGKAEITLGLLSAVASNSRVTQRTLAKDLGIALGLANTYLKRCVRKGWIKVNLVPANRYAYYLTPRGFAQKSRLTALYLTVSFNFFRGARNQCTAVFEECVARRWTRVALAGASDLAEIAALCARDTGLEIVGIVDSDADFERFAGLPVVGKLEHLAPVNAIVVTDLKSPQATFDLLANSLPAEQLLTPPMLRIARTRLYLAE